MNDSVEKAAKAHTNLNIFAAVVAIMESGSLYNIGTAHSTAIKITRLCEKEEHRQLRIYDRERSK